MDSHTLALLYVATAFVELPPHLASLIDDGSWWVALGRTPEDRRDAEQLEMLARLGFGSRRAT